ncbi:hypothetical protein N8D77_13485 [Curtobacterium flaccumfaciens]|uniref:hypothetical protein n=1 Tax=Curtobacterium flaccumfaciens TaxID=2035 RepID=UPI0021CA89C5|nr:hypothetical protein [Curtobacterium flaccumfaciens]UXN21155.1 hypothetical protein N8D77_13485 [Curtobacterium flaccumfaciens pv. flaccumfaciens]
MSDRQWMQDIRHQQTILSLPFGLGWTIDITDTLTALAAAGMPARVEAFDRLRFEDGRIAFLATPNPTSAIDDGIADDQSTDLVLLPGGSEGGVLSLVRRYPDLVVVNGKRQRVWADGRQIHGSSMQRDATPGWRDAFAIARTVTIHGGSTTAIAKRTGIPVEEIRTAMPALGAHVVHTPLGWEATDRSALIDWAIAAYPGPGGVRTRWKRAASIDEQADQLIALGGVMSDSWAAHQFSSQVRPHRLTAFFAEHPDMTALGYEPAAVDETTVKIIVPQDTTILSAAEQDCCTDEFITAAVIYDDSYTNAHTDAVNVMRSLLHFQADTAYDLRWMHVQ